MLVIILGSCLRMFSLCVNRAERKQTVWAGAGRVPSCPIHTEPQHFASAASQSHTRRGSSSLILTTQEELSYCCRPVHQRGAHTQIRSTPSTWASANICCLQFSRTSVRFQCSWATRLFVYFLLPIQSWLWLFLSQFRLFSVLRKIARHNSERGEKSEFWDIKS